MYEYSKSVKSSVSDEPINTYLLRPLAGLVVRALYKTRVTPNQVTAASTIAGLIAALVYLNSTPLAVACAGLLVTAKDVLDSADGQLARAKEQYSRIGRFFDSIGDFVVNAALFASIGYVLSTKDGNFAHAILAIVGLAGTTFRVSYHVFYQASFLHREKKYQTNRISEEVRDEDKSGDRTALHLQRIFQAIYGWQDSLILRIDKWCMGGQPDDEVQKRWYLDIAGIRLSGFLGMGTELFVLTICSLLNELALYLYVNAVLMNGVLLFNILYRRCLLRRRLLAWGDSLAR
jgi:archaetidylinositol phosphate synthase